MKLKPEQFNQLEVFIDLLGRTANERGSGFWVLDYLRKTFQDIILEDDVQMILKRDIKHLRELDNNPMTWEINKRD